MQIVVRYRKFSTSLATGGRFLGRKMKTIGRGTPCGCPPPLVGALRGLFWRPNLDAIALPQNRIPLDFLVQVCENIASMVTECQNALSFGVWHLLERVAKPRDLTAD